MAFLQDLPSTIFFLRAAESKKIKKINTDELLTRRNKFPVKLLQDLPSKSFFPTICSTQESKGFYTLSYVRGQRSCVLKPRIPFFWFTSSGVHKQPVSFEVLAPAFCILQGSHVQRQFRKWTTLRSKSSTLKGLLYALEPHNHEKGMLSDQPRLSRVSSTVLLCCWGRSCSKI